MEGLAAERNKVECRNEDCVAMVQKTVRGHGLCRFCRERQIKDEERTKREDRIRREEEMRASGQYVIFDNLVEVMKLYNLTPGTIMMLTGKREWEIAGWMSGLSMSPDDAKAIVEEVWDRKKLRDQRIRKAGIRA